MNAGWKLIGLAAAGGLGALARYALAMGVQRFAGTGFPLGTFAVNMLGCFAFGLVFGLLERSLLPSDLRPVVLTGFMGAFTTFSTYAFESHALLKSGQYALAALNLGGQVALGVLAVALGLALAKSL
ncbi:MAG: fluoride efflux transporter CrcB [Okeania sp. SIO3B3]|nr:fluoride efflux transporter CrcB [Okeania sp. SIO3B3]